MEENKITLTNNQLSKNPRIASKIDDIIKTQVYPGAQQVYNLIKKDYPELRLEDIRHYLLTKPEYQLTWERKQTPQNMGHIISYVPFSVCQIDIFDLSKFSYDYTQYKSKKKIDGITTNFNHGYKYIFCLIDVFSRYADAVMMKTKDINDTTHALQIILDYNKINPLVLMSDSDSSFLGGKFQQLLTERNIQLDPVVVNDHRALGIIDRFARTLKTRITKLFLANGNSNWVDYLADIIYSYNNTPNRGILNYSPHQALTDPDAQEAILQLNIEKANKNESLNSKKDIKPGDHIRLFIENPMRKGTEPNYTTQVYEVKKRNGKKITLTNGKVILDQNVLKINDHQYTDNNLLTENGDGVIENVIDEANRENKITRKLKKAGIERPTHETLHEPRSRRNIATVDYKKLNG